MNENLTELVFILDKSGSMYGLEKDTIGGFNSLIEKQKNEKGDALVTTVLFNSQETFIHKRVPLKEIKEMTGNDYFVGGCTALLDAVGNTIQYVSEEQGKLKEEDIPSKTMVIITTDGLENASREFSYKAIKMLTEDKKKSGWEFLFLGANIDAAHEAGKLGIDEDHSVKYENSCEGVAMNYEALSCAIKEVRSSGSMSVNWKKKVKKVD